MPILYILAILIFGSIALFFLFTQSDLLPKSTIERIKQTKESSIPERITGQTGIAQNGKIKIFYEVLGSSSSKGDILLVNGHTHSLIAWPKHFYQPLIDAGYRVIRYDNRGMGNSDWMKNWTKQNAYKLEDMATDGIAVLKALDIEKAHIIGMSMGGMIGQRMAISHSEHVHSLTSIMSTGHYFDKKEKNTSFKFYKGFVRNVVAYKPNPKIEESTVKLYVAVQRLLVGKGNYDFDDQKYITDTFYEIRHRNGLNPKAGLQHSKAIKLSGSRLEELDNIKAPTLIIHGTDDTLILIGQGKKCASKIPDAEALYVEGMGHDLPDIYMDKIHSAIFKNINLVIGD